ncbi:MarR family winged helix-turn-helix transcriptional regulator [Promicromonospora sp. NPDC057488]|uniref:MarR family winged helix-turn-helix transcriptional regulator n=1 Tax=Promicromonospora sp. NPDC057488 TaxID=3346147 RepID=UPI00366AEC65
MVPESALLPGRSLLDPRVLDPGDEIVGRAGLTDNDIDQVVHVLEGLKRWREAEHRLTDDLRERLQVGGADMQMLRFAAAAESRAEVVTPRALSDHLGLSSAAITKMLNRLARAGHVRRLPHPMDRRSIMVQITGEAQLLVRQAMDQEKALERQAIGRLNTHDLGVVIRFLNELSATGS